MNKKKTEQSYFQRWSFILAADWESAALPRRSSIALSVFLSKAKNRIHSSLIHPWFSIAVLLGAQLSEVGRMKCSPWRIIHKKKQLRNISTMPPTSQDSRDNGGAQNCLAMIKTIKIWQSRKIVRLVQIFPKWQIDGFVDQPMFWAKSYLLIEACQWIHQGDQGWMGLVVSQNTWASKLSWKLETNGKPSAVHTRITDQSLTSWKKASMQEILIFTQRNTHYPPKPLYHTKQIWKLTWKQE